MNRALDRYDAQDAAGAVGRLVDALEQARRREHELHRELRRLRAELEAERRLVERLRLRVHRRQSRPRRPAPEQHALL